jgi:TRAP-type C4-dicarboxylate transport system permease small subunit
VTSGGGLDMTRRALDALYHASGGVAAFFLAAIAVIVLMQVGANVIDALSRWMTGRPIGLLVPSYADFAGYFLATSSFLALAHTLRKDAHIRVALVVQRLGPRRRQGAELWASGFAASLTGYFSWYMMGLVRQSWRFGDVSPGIVPVPLWIPQAAMAAGLVILTIALVDVFVTLMTARDAETAPVAADAAPEER